DRRGNLWIGLGGKGLDRFDIKGGKFIHYRYKPLDKKSFKNNVIRQIYEDSSGNLWIGTYGGFNKFDLETGQFTHWVHEPDNPKSLSHNSVHSIQEGREGKIWIATFGGGLNRFDPETGYFEHWRHDPMDPESLGSDNLFSLYIDRHKNLWIGTYAKGAEKLALKAKKFTHFMRKPGDPNSLSHDMVLSIYQDRAGFLWIGTLGGGLNKFDPESKTFTHYKHDPKNPNSLSHNSVMSICGGEGGILWIGTEGGGLNKFDPETEIFTQYKWDSKNPKKLSYGVIQRMHMGKSGFLWIGTNGGGLNRLDPRTDIFKWWIPKRGDPKSLSNSFVTSVLEDKNEVVWVGTGGGGLNRFDPRTEIFSRYVYNPDDPGSIRGNIVSVIYESKAGDLWIGASGLNKFDRENGNFLHYTTNDGLPSNGICGILEDESGNFWISTSRGLSKFNPRSNTFRNFDKSDGLQANQFSQASFKNLRTGQLFFGGHNGFNAFFPDDIEDNLYVPPVVITDFKILNKSVNINNDKTHPKSPLKQSITETKEITLSYKDYDFSFEFSALNYMVPEKNQYAYKMEGLHKEWIRADSRNRHAHFTTLSPGKYIFRVKGSNNDGVWNQVGTSITVFITPPFWKTWWFRSLSVIFFAMLSYLFIHYLKKYFTLIAFWKKKIRVGEYSIIDKIGSGGMATIYKARDTRDKSIIVALKVIRDDIMMDTVQRKRFINEGTIIGSLNHPNIVNIIKRGEDDQKLYIAMEILEGRTLAEKMRHEKVIPVKDCLEIMVQL
ncbi:MAG: protein kinase, partial [Candidatus Aminicenantes bacterium]|nr:protein kinase [Candidatus Aminicenantes bacterium]